VTGGVIPPYAQPMGKDVNPRAHFNATIAPPLAKQVGVAVTAATTKRGWTSRGSWFDEPDHLTGVFGPQEERHVDLALAHGLKLAAGRPLRLVLPAAWAYATRQRLPWMNAPITVHVFDDSHAPTVVQPKPLSRAEAQRGAGGFEATPDLHLGAAGDHVLALLEWATRNPNLAEAHRRDVKAWTCHGQRVLRITRSGNGVLVLAGIDAKAKALVAQKFNAPLDKYTLDALKSKVEEGIEEAESKTHGAFREHQLQETLRLNPAPLAVESPVLREVPAFRPFGDGPSQRRRGFIDLVGKDGVGDIVLVETKLAADDMLVLQGLDYWNWASHASNWEWLVARLHADPKRARLKLLYAIGEKDGSQPKPNPYAMAQLKVLDGVDWRIAHVSDWLTGSPNIDFLPAGQVTA